MLALLYETLNDGEKRAVTKHLLTCLRCQMIMKKLSGLKTFMENVPKPAVEGTWAQELRRAEAKWELTEKESAYGPFTGLFSFLSRSLALQIGFAAVAVILVGTIILRGQFAGEKMTVVKAAGGVNVNNVSFFEKTRTVYDLGKKVELVISDGECVFQVGKNTLIIAEKDTVLTVESGKTVRINLVKGNIIAKVGMMPGKSQDTIIATPRGNFLVTKAVFYVRSEENFTECGVKQGELRTLADGKDVTLTEMAKVTIDRDGKQYLAKMDGTDRVFGKLDQYRYN